MFLSFSHVYIYFTFMCLPSICSYLSPLYTYPSPLCTYLSSICAYLSILCMHLPPLYSYLSLVPFIHLFFLICMYLYILYIPICPVSVLHFSTSTNASLFGLFSACRVLYLYLCFTLSEMFSLCSLV